MHRADHAGHDGHAAHADHAAQDEHHPSPVPRDPDLPTVRDSTVAFFAAASLVVFAVALATLLD